MLLNNAQRGDVAIFSDGTYAVIHSMSKISSGNIYVTFDREVTGWVNQKRYKEWSYHGDGLFVVSEDSENRPHIDIVKVVHND